MRSFLCLLLATSAVLLGGCNWVADNQTPTPTGEQGQVPIDPRGTTPDLNDDMPQGDPDENMALPELSAELIAEYKSKLIEDISEFYLEDGDFCKKTSGGICQDERDRRQNWNFAILNEIGRHEFLQEFKGKKTLIIPGESEASGKYIIYNTWFDNDNSHGTVYIGEPRPFESERFGSFANLFLVPLAYLGDAPNMFTVPFYNFDKKRAYEKQANASIRWVVVDCKKKTQFTNTVVYFKGDITNKDVLQSYSNDDRVLDYHVSFSGLQSLMTRSYPFAHTPSSPFNDICSG